MELIWGISDSLLFSIFNDLKTNGNRNIFTKNLRYFICKINKNNPMNGKKKIIIIREN